MQVTPVCESCLRDINIHAVLLTTVNSANGVSYRYGRETGSPVITKK